MSGSDSRRQRRLAAREGDRSGDAPASDALRAWVQRQLALAVRGLGVGWVGKQVQPPEDMVSDVGCPGCGIAGAARVTAMLTRHRPSEKVVLFTLVRVCANCAGDSEKTRALGARALGPPEPPPAQA